MTVFGKTLTMLVFLMSVLFLAFSAVVFWNHRDLQTEAVEELTPKLNRVNEEIASLTVETAELLESVAHEKEALRTALVALEARALQTEELLNSKARTVDGLDQTHRERIAELTSIQAELKSLVRRISGPVEAGDPQPLETEIASVKALSAKEFERVVELTSEIHEAVGAHRRLSERQRQLERRIKTIEDGLAKAGVSEFSTKTADLSAGTQP